MLLKYSYGVYCFMKKLYYDAKDISEILGVSKSTTHRRIRQMNEELTEQGYYAEYDKVPIPLFYEKYPDLREELNKLE